jgi:hypothetical protein
MWTARRILKELTDTELRRKVLIAFWKHADGQARALANAYMSKAMNFRDETIRKMPADKKSDLLASRLGAPDFDQFFEMALMQYHTNQKGELLGAFLDKWGIPHVDGAIEVDEYRTPTIEQVRSAASELQPQFPLQDIRLYLASAGLLMGEDWAAVTWPVVDELTQPAS